MGRGRPRHLNLHTIRGGRTGSAVAERKDYDRDDDEGANDDTYEPDAARMTAVSHVEVSDGCSLEMPSSEEFRLSFVGEGFWISHLPDGMSRLADSAPNIRVAWNYCSRFV